MSIRVLFQRYLHHVQTICSLRIFAQPLPPIKYTKFHTNKIHLARLGEQQSHVPPGTGNALPVGSHLSFLGTQARRLFVNNILKRVTNTLTSDLRRRAVNRHIYGDAAPFFSLIGVSLASGTGILTKEDEFEGICWEIRDAVQKMFWNTASDDFQHMETLDKTEISLQNFVIGPHIAKGSSAVVYAVRNKTSEEMRSHNAIIDTTSELYSFPLAMKMMFNYDTESNASAILVSMYKETIPALRRSRNPEISFLEEQLAESFISLPSHPNIVKMYYVFADRIPPLPQSSVMYPDALPTRLNPEGSGRNMSLFLLMKRYDITLKEYLIGIKHNRNIRELILLFTQLLEGLYHMNFHKVAHRDLKSDNILLDLSGENEDCPSLVITDFGCCLADKLNGLHIPYNTHSMDKGGNTALMAPEIITTKPGSFTKLNYSKSDLWTAGTIAYEIFGSENPFYSSQNRKGLSSYDYEETELPRLPEDVPGIVSSVITNCLQRSISKRLSIENAATIMQLYLWAPNSWLHCANEIPSSSEILQWLICLTSKVLYEIRPNFGISETTSDVGAGQVQKSLKRSLSTRSCGRRTLPEYQLISNFLGRANLSTIRYCLQWIKKYS